MSIRAHRVVEILHAQPESFDLGHDSDLMVFLRSKGFYGNLSDDGYGITTVTVEVMQEALDTLDLQPGLIANIKKDINVAHQLKHDYISYYCY